MKMNQKGVAPIVIAIIIALLFGVGGYALVKTNPGLSQKLGLEKQVEKKEVKVDETAGWKTYTNEKYGFEIKYPDSVSVQNSDNGISLAFADKQRKIDIEVESIEPGQDCRKTAWAADAPNITIDNTIFVGVSSGLKDEPYYGVLYCTIRDGFDYMITSHLFHVSGGPNNYPEDDIVLNQIISTLKFTAKYIPTVPTSEQQSVINYLQANITKMIKAKPVLGATKWSFYQIAFYPANKVLVSFEDGHITGGFLGSYSINGSQVSVTYIAEVVNTGDEDKKLSEKYNLAAEAAVRFQQTSGSGFELIK